MRNVVSYVLVCRLRLTGSASDSGRETLVKLHRVERAVVAS